MALKELKRSNEDLEQFASVASHDLQEPLRAVSGFLGVLDKKHADNLDADARQYIAYAVDGAERMHSLINDLLSYSRVGTKGGSFNPIPMQEALEQARENVRFSIEESRATVTSDPLPTIFADKVQITQLLQNLIGNAIKFRGPKPPEIRILAKREEHQWVFGVRDNGIGIEPRYFEKIFLIFQRLHTNAQYKGTGIGLAICKRIVERHGGRIWVESKPGEGSTFHFTIPG